MTRITLHKEHAYVTAKTSETCSGGKARSRLEITAPRNTRLHLPRRFFAKIKLLDNAGNQIDRYAVIFVRKIRPNDRKPAYLADFDYTDFADLAPDQQDSQDNRASLTVDLGHDVTVNPQETISIEIIGADAVDWTKPGTVFEFRAAEEVL